nr:hypothetical protein [Arthrobacter sp. SDTb3-6]
MGDCSGSHSPARGHDLDDVDAPKCVVVDSGSDGFSVVGLATQEPAMPASGSDGRACRNNTRAGCRLFGGFLTQHKGEVVPVAKVADRRYAVVHHGPGPEAHGGREVPVHRGLDVDGCRVAGIEDQVGVGVDQAGQQCGIAQLVDRHVTFHPGPAGFDGADEALVHHHRRPAGGQQCRAIKNAARTDREPFGCWFCPSHGGASSEIGAV